MVSLRCWLTTTDERDPTENIPDQAGFLSETAFQDTR